MTSLLSQRFRGFYPVVVDIETGGFHSQTDAILELAAVPLTINSEGELCPMTTLHYHIEPFEGSRITPEALAFTGINPDSELRQAVSETVAFQDLFGEVRQRSKAHECKRAILVGHNAHFDHGFIKAAEMRHQLKRNPFHSFTSIDTASLAALVLGHTVLAEACRRAHIVFDARQAHSAAYDAEKTAELFCYMVNLWGKYKEHGKDLI